MRCADKLTCRGGHLELESSNMEQQCRKMAMLVMTNRIMRSESNESLWSPSSQ